MCVLQDLCSTVQQLRSELQVKEAQLKESEADKHAELLAKDKIISELQYSLREKERMMKVSRFFALIQPVFKQGRTAL